LILPRLKHPPLPLLQQGFSTCLDYFFSFKEVKRLLSSFMEQDMLCRSLLSFTGFQPMHRLPGLTPGPLVKQWVSLSSK